MLSALRKVLSFEMTIAEWIGTPVMLAAPHLIIGARVNRVAAGAVAVDGVPGMRPANCRIDIRRRTARWDPAAEGH
jgi:hypothetical protein